MDGSGHFTRGFGDDGVVVKRFGYDATGTEVVVRGGRILVGVEYSDSESNAAAVLALEHDGDRDRSFGGDGITVIDPEESLDGGVVIAAHPGGGVVLGDAAATDTGAYEPFLALLDADGAFVTSFGDGGVVVVPMRGMNFASGVFVRPDGRIVVGGTREVDNGTRLLAVQVQA
jgi:beta-propeller uncharacterized protein DUF5122